MIDPDLKSQLEVINQNLNEIKRKSGGPGIWRAFFNGMFSALGYVVGIVIITIILIWFLNKVGWLSSFDQQLQNFLDVINQAKNLTAPAASSGSGSSSTSSSSGGLGSFTLPNGQKINLSLPNGY